MASFSSNKHHSFLLDSSSIFLIPDTTSCFSEQSIHDIYKPFSPHQHHSFYDQADPTMQEALPSAILSTDSTGITKISTCINNSSSSAASAQYDQVTNPAEKRKIKCQPHSKVTVYQNLKMLFTSVQSKLLKLREKSQTTIIS